MRSKKYIEAEIAQLSTLRLITQAYAQIASFRIRKMRNGVLSTRVYLGEISSVFKDVLLSYRRQAEAVARKYQGRNKRQVTFLSHNGRSVAVFLSANTRLYGDLISRTFEAFYKDVSNQDIEITVVGKHGLALFEERDNARPFTYFDFPDARIDQAALKALVQHLSQYEEIKFYYPEFENAVVQKPQMMRLTAGESITTGSDNQKTGAQNTNINYSFEPSLEKVLAFFETQIFSALIQQTITESQLAKFASRVLSMDTAGEKIRDEIKKTQLDKLKLAHSIFNKKQMQVYTALRVLE